jgi:hypothetical protein
MRKRKNLAELSLRERVGKFVHFSRLKRELAGLILSLDEFEKWERIMRTLIKDDFARTFQRWL